MGRERGSSLIETLVSLALLGVISATFLGALGTAPQARSVADEQATARILAESQMENAKKQVFFLSYNTTAIPTEYTGYAALIDVDSLRNGSIQKITVTVSHNDREITSLESYKTSR